MNGGTSLIPAKYRRGVSVLAIALALIVAAAVVSWLSSAAQQLADQGRARIPGTVTFDAKARSYDVLVSPRVGNGNLTPEVLARRVACEVTHPGGDGAEPLGGSVRSVTEFGATIGSFRGRPGPTEVACAWTDTRTGRLVSNRFFVASRMTALQTATWIAFGVAALLVLAGVLMLRSAAQRP